MPVRYALLMCTLLVMQLNAAGPFTSGNSPEPAAADPHGLPIPPMAMPTSGGGIRRNENRQQTSA